MFKSLDIFQTAGAMARHAGARQAVVARNIANADTPGYQAQATRPFSETYRSQGNMTVRATRAGHIPSQASTSLNNGSVGTAEPSPNGNSVSIEEEMMKSVAISREHNRALAIYRHGLTILRSSIGR